MPCKHEHTIATTLESIDQYYDGMRDEWGDRLDYPRPEYVVSVFCSDCQADVSALYADQLGMRVAPPELRAYFDF